MTNFRQFAVPQGGKEIEAVLQAAFRERGVDAASCDLIGAQDSSLIEIVVHPSNGQSFRFKVAVEDALNHGLAGKVDLAVRSAARTPGAK